MAKDEARKAEHRPRNHDREVQNTCGASSRQQGARRRLRCHNCARIVTVSGWKTMFGGYHEWKKHTNWLCAICGEKYDWKQPNRLLVVQTCESVNQCQGLQSGCSASGPHAGILIKALKLLADQQEDGDGVIQKFVTKLL